MTTTDKNIIDQFADIRILKFDIDTFNSLTLKQKKLVYYLSEATLCGRDIIFDQHFKHNLVIRQVIETIVKNKHQIKHNLQNFNHIETYLKQIWFSNGIHHHYSTTKIKPLFTYDDFEIWFDEADCTSLFNLKNSKIIKDTLNEVIFSNSKYTIRVSQNNNEDLIEKSCNNFYDNISQIEVETYYDNKKKHEGSLLSHGLNSQLIKQNGNIIEIPWSQTGKYASAITEIIYWLEKVLTVTECEAQKTATQHLIEYYKTGNLEHFDQYNIKWLTDQTSLIDYINGFIEVYGDPMGIKGSWEALVNITNITKTEKVKTLSNNAQWFEDKSPIAPQYRKKTVSGVSMKIIDVVILGGDCYPASPLGINLPNADWIREKHGSKSVSLANISKAHQMASQHSGVIEAFAANQIEIDLHKQYGSEADHLHTHLHECLGHGSGKLKQNVTGDMLKSYASVIEETRADLFALYFMMDKKMEELGLSPNNDLAKTHYNSYIRNGLMVQLTRVELGNKLEQAHMRNRQLIAKWVFKNQTEENIIKELKINGLTYYKVVDYDALRIMFAKLLFEVQRIKSEGDYEAAKNLVETYGVMIDYDLHKEVLERFAKLNIAPFAGFVNPTLKPTINSDGIFTNVLVHSCEDYSQQMFYYSSHYSYLMKGAIKEFEESLQTN